METKKCICISHFEFKSAYRNGIQFIVNPSEIREYYMDDNDYYITDGLPIAVGTSYPVDFFHRHFVDLIEYRNDIIENVLDGN